MNRELAVTTQKREHRTKRIEAHKAKTSVRHVTTQKMNHSRYAPAVIGKNAVIGESCAGTTLFPGNRLRSGKPNIISLSFYVQGKTEIPNHARDVAIMARRLPPYGGQLCYSAKMLVPAH